MVKIIRIVVIFLLVTFAAGCVQNGDTAPGPEPKNTEKQEQVESNSDEEIKTLLTDDFKNVEEIGVLYSYASSGDYIEVRYDIAKDKDKIEEIYKSIKETKEKYNKREAWEDGQESNPTFIIRIYYSSGNMDEIASTETGEAIYRNTSTENSSWVGGKNTELKKLLGDGSELYSTEYSKQGNSIKDKLVALQNNIKNENKEEIANIITANLTEGDYESLKEGKLEDYGTIIYYQNGDISIEAINRKTDRNEFMTFRFVKVEDDMKLDSLECITDIF